jgi:hypothetical protein
MRTPMRRARPGKGVRAWERHGFFGAFFFRL